MATDNSVMVALSELTRMEASRVGQEQALAAARAREAQEKTARAAAAEREAAEAKRAADALVAARLEADARARALAEVEQDRRLAAMRAELESIRRDRELMHGALTARIAAPPEPPRSRGLALGFGISSSIAAALAALLVVQANAARTSAMTTSTPVAETRVAHVVETPARALDAETIAEPAPALPAPEATPVAAAGARGTRPPRRDDARDTDRETERDRDRERDTHSGLGAALNFGDSDGMVPVERRP